MPALKGFSSCVSSGSKTRRTEDFVLTACGFDSSFCSPNRRSSSGSRSLCIRGGGFVEEEDDDDEVKWVSWVTGQSRFGFALLSGERNGERRRGGMTAFCEAMARAEPERRGRVQRNIIIMGCVSLVLKDSYFRIRSIRRLEQNGETIMGKRRITAQMNLQGVEFKFAVATKMAWEAKGRRFLFLYIHIRD